MKKIILFTAALFIGCGGGGGSYQTEVLGGAADDYLINADVEIYDLSGKRVDKGCKTSEYGMFDCNVSLRDEKLIYVVRGGVLDKDGNLSTTDDETPFEGAFVSLAKSSDTVIISPFSSKLLADKLGVSLNSSEGVYSFDKNFDVLNYISLIDSNFDSIYRDENNAFASHILSTKDKELLKYSIKHVSDILDTNASLASESSSGDFRLRIVHINDTHSNLEPVNMTFYINSLKTSVNTGGYGAIASYIKFAKADSHILALHAGDAIQGTLYYNVSGGAASAEAFDLMGLDAMSVGNHEFDEGADAFAKNFALKANFPILACDINTTNEYLKDIIKPYVIKEIGSEKVAVVGDTINSSLVSNPGPTIVFSNYLDAAEKYIQILKNEGINKIIFLTHLGYDKDKTLAQEVPDIDIIVGGHSHTLLGDFSDFDLRSYGEYPSVVEHNDSKTLIVTAWKWGLVIGDLEVVFDKEGKIKNYVGIPKMLFEKKEIDALPEENRENFYSFAREHTNVAVVPDDEGVDEVIAKYKPQVDKLLNTNIAYASQDLIHVRLPGDKDYTTGEVLQNGSLLAPVVAEAMYEKANEVEECDFAFENAGGVRASLYKGDVSVGEIYTMLPYSNTLVIAKLDGKTIKEMLENEIDRALIKKWDTGAFAYFANAKITIDTNASLGERVVRFQIKKGDSWVDLDENATYTFVTNSYVANGGDYYKEMWSADKYDTGFVDAEVFLDYAKEKEELAPLSYDVINTY